MGTRTRFRAVDGILLLDKPHGISSNAALQRARHLFRAEKGGHTGALDPLATGLLPLCFGEATKLAGYLLGEDKAYQVEAQLGVSTDTDDADGRVVAERPFTDIRPEAIAAALGAFVGRIQQRPPLYSALKRDGEALYRKARRGETPHIDAREVQVQAIHLLEYADGRLRLEIECGSGTYVRSLVRDLGETLGCGGHVTALRRQWVNPFRTPQMWTLDALMRIAERDPAALDACLLPIEAALAGWTRIELDAEQAQRLGQGQAQPIELPAGSAMAFDSNGRALGIVAVDEGGLLRAKRLFSWAAL